MNIDKSKTILITGGSGLIGTALIERLYGKYNIVSVDKAPYNRYEDIRFIQIDITCRDCIKEIFQKYRPDIVVHLASPLSDFTEKNPRGAMEVGLIPSISLLELSIRHGVEKFIFASSLAVYGSGNPYYPDKPLDEDVPPYPDSVYGSMKLTVEHIINIYRERYGLNATSIRPSVVISRRRKRGYTALLIDAIKMAYKNRKLILPGSPELQVFWVHINDVVDAFYKVIQYDGKLHRAYNVTAPLITLGDIANEIKRLIKGLEIIYIDEKPLFTPPKQGYSTDRIRKELRWNPVYVRAKDILTEIIGDVKNNS